MGHTGRKVSGLKSPALNGTEVAAIAGVGRRRRGAVVVRNVDAVRRSDGTFVVTVMSSSSFLLEDRCKASCSECMLKLESVSYLVGVDVMHRTGGVDVVL